MTIRKHLAVIGTYYRAGILAELEYRANFLAALGMTFGALVWTAAGISVFFYHRETIGGWTYNEALLVVGMFILFEGVIDSVLRPNVTRLVEHIQKGTLDFVLVKPANSQVLGTLTAFSPLRVLDIGAGMIVIGVALARLGTWPTAAQIGLFAALVAAGAVILYSMFLGLVSIAFWFVKVDNITELFSAFYESGRLPVSVFRGTVRIVLTFVVPIAFLTTFPAGALVGRTPAVFVLIAWVLAVTLLTAATRFWRHALRFYSSASS